jgi:hypothetical protein
MALRIAAIGCGDIAQRRFFPQIKALGARAELVAIAARDVGRLRSCAACFDVPRIYTDAATMLRDDAVDAVLVLTPPPPNTSSSRVCCAPVRSARSPASNAIAAIADPRTRGGSTRSSFRAAACCPISASTA